MGKTTLWRAGVATGARPRLRRSSTLTRSRPRPPCRSRRSLTSSSRSSTSCAGAPGAAARSRSRPRCCCGRHGGRPSTGGRSGPRRSAPSGPGRGPDRLLVAVDDVQWLDAASVGGARVRAAPSPRRARRRAVHRADQPDDGARAGLGRMASDDGPCRWARSASGRRTPSCSSAWAPRSRDRSCAACTRCPGATRSTRSSSPGRGRPATCVSPSPSRCRPRLADLLGSRIATLPASTRGMLAAAAALSRPTTGGARGRRRRGSARRACSPPSRRASSSCATTRSGSPTPSSRRPPTPASSAADRRRIHASLASRRGRRRGARTAPRAGAPGPGRRRSPRRSRPRRTRPSGAARPRRPRT